MKKTAEKVRLDLKDAKKLIEKKMFCGIAFMMNNKMAWVSTRKI